MLLNCSKIIFKYAVQTDSIAIRTSDGAKLADATTEADTAIAVITNFNIAYVGETCQEKLIELASNQLAELLLHQEPERPWFKDSIIPLSMT